MGSVPWSNAMIELDTVINVERTAIVSSNLLGMNRHFFSEVVEPYRLGSDENGHILLLAWQLSGGCDSRVSLAGKAFSCWKSLPSMRWMNCSTQFPE